MNIWSKTVLTDKGLALMAKLTQGNTLNITKAMTGAGFVAPALLAEQTAITDPKQTLRFKTVSYPENGKCAIPVMLKNEGLTTGYEATQVGLFAADPDEGEILLFISQAADEENGTTIPSETEMPGYSAEWTFYLAYGQADGVSVTVDPANTVSRQELEEHVDETFKKMKGDINMDGHRITNVAEPTQGSDVATRHFVEQHTLAGNLYVAVDYNNDGNIVLKPYVADEDVEMLYAHLKNKGNPHGVTPVQIGAAPAGYGLGTTAKVVDTLDNAVGNGFYYSEKGGPHPDYWYAIVHSYDDSGNWVIQQAWNNIASEVGTVYAVRRKCNGVWHDWEYDRPPMYFGTEYRTTERWQASAVYVQMVEINTLPNNATESITINANNVFAPIDVSISLKRKADGVRFAGHKSIFAYLSLTGGTLKANIEASADMSGYTGYITVRYIKN